MKRLKLFFVFATVFTIAVLLLTVFASAAEPDYEGSDGDVTWKLYSTSGKLVVSGTGQVEDLTHIQNYLCDVKSLVIEEGVSSIGSGAFYGFGGLISVSLPTSITSIGPFAFGECTALTSITIPASVNSIGPCAFSMCSGLASITLPASLSSLGGSAFEECTSLSSIIIPNGITVIEEYTFYGCSSLASVTLPASVTAIENHAFASCREIESVYLYSPTVTSALTSPSACGDLLKYAKSVYIPESITEVPTYIQAAFPHTKSLTLGGLSHTVYADPSNHNWNGGIVSKEATHLQEGVRTFTCVNCGETQTSTIEKITQHTYSEWKTVKEATKDAAGLREKVCACGNKVSEEIPQLESNVGVIVAIVGGSTVAVGGGGVALWWFVFKKKKRI